jgi:hypothetical protein
MRIACVIALAACSSAAPPPPTPPVAHVADAGVDAPPPDAPDPSASAAPWIFRYHATDRTETWTLRYAGGRAQLAVESATGTRRYAGTATEGATVAIDVTSGSARMTLDCKKAQRKLGAKCNDPAGKQVDVLDCYHPDFKTPMPFAPAPGVEFVSDATCTGYRLIAQ